MQRRRRPWGADLRRTRVAMVPVRTDGRDGRGHECGMQPRLAGTRSLGVTRVQAVARLVQLDAERPRPAPARAVGTLPRADPWREVGAAEAIPGRRLNADQAARQGVRAPANRPVGVNRPALADEGLVREPGIAGGAGEQRVGDLPPGDVGYRGRPVVLQADDDAHVSGVARPEASATGVGQVRQPAVAPPGRVDLQRPAVMRPGGADVVPPSCPAPDGEHLRDLARRVGASAGTVVAPGIADRHRRGIHDVPRLSSAQGAWQVDLLGRAYARARSARAAIHGARGTSNHR